MARTLPTLGVVLSVAGLAGCLSYQRPLGEDEPARRDSSPALPEPARGDGPAPAPSAPAPPADPPAPDASEPASSMVEAFPGIRVDARRGVVEFDAEVSPLIFEPFEGRNFYLEQFVCKRHTKDHESLVVTDAVPSQIHAALLLLGLEPGSPVVWTSPEGIPIARAPSGPALRVDFLVGEGGDRAGPIDPRDWTVEKGGERRFPEGEWVFAGSAIAGEPEAPFYEADAAGTIVGLASFGTEVVAWGAPISHEEAEGELQWIAALEAMPPAETPVVVRITRAD